MKIDKVRVCLGCMRPIRKRGRFHRWVDGWGNKTCAHRWAGLGPHRPGHPGMKARQGAPSSFVG